MSLETWPLAATASACSTTPTGWSCRSKTIAAGDSCECDEEGGVLEAEVTMKVTPDVSYDEVHFSK